MLTVPGAEIYYEVRGSGRPLLLVNGGDGDAALFGPLAALLAEYCTVITFDLRGNSRSRLTGPPEEQRIEGHGQDAHLLLSAVAGGEPAYVFGTSYGGMIGMDLLARHPGQVRALVAHEPFVIDLLPDADRWHAFFQEVCELHEREGLDPALQKFCDALGVDAPPEPAEELPEPVRQVLARLRANVDTCLKYELRSFVRFRPDVAALRSARFTLVTGGEGPRTLLHRTTSALADSVGTGIVEFPGGHVGFLTHPADFATALRATFES
ncbi:alpha/beta fold hydrolase [Streptomyces griseocarneus]|uniref:alpha/beta fold hydrolase n=1 Tax=Streptomyces griseocarneus TaxID=51201 RepID=UPI00167EAFC4|nr:alpha/beta hydrolase [Streptomyces griseocarneus]MBZ6475492.1 alpha/beta hydrolase [Streptomyces griseocarneus]GHG75595.1 putative hydrolase YraK [Streptomyces griseocarneus]